MTVRRSCDNIVACVAAFSRAGVDIIAAVKAGRGNTLDILIIMRSLIKRSDKSCRAAFCCAGIGYAAGCLTGCRNNLFLCIVKGVRKFWERLGLERIAAAGTLDNSRTFCKAGCFGNYNIADLVSESRYFFGVIFLSVFVNGAGVGAYARFGAGRFLCNLRCEVMTGSRND